MYNYYIIIETCTILERENMITEKDMQYVLTIANYGNLTKAANALFLSQPALSIHLKQLETSLGIQLFERKGRRMILTYAGEEFVKSARDITMKCFELEDRMIDIGKNVAVKLRIGYMVRQVESLFPSVMTAFNRLYPQSVVYAIDGHLSDHEEQLLAGDLDMFFGYNSVSNTRLSYETIYEDCLVAILPKSHPAVSFAESKESCIYPWLDLAHVRKERFILQHSNQSIRQLEEDALFYADVLPELTYKISSIDAGIRLAEQGYGIAFTLNSYLTSMKLSPDSVVLQVGDPDMRIPFSAAFRKEDENRKELKEWIRLTKELVSGQ
jgi:DNA-binding transcriptional LysR family regulator